MQVRSLGQEDPLEKEIATHSSILAWRIPWQRSLESYSPWGRRESDTTEGLACTRVHTHTHTHTQKVTVWGNKNFWKWMWWWLLNNVIGLNFSQYHILLTHSSLHGHLSHFHFLPIENNAVAYVGAQIFLWVPAFASYGCTPRRRIPGAYGNPAWLSEESPYHLPQQLIHFTCSPATNTQAFQFL